MVGTDFTLITKLLRTRTREEIKKKFKKEDKKNRGIINMALSESSGMDLRRSWLRFSK